MENRRGSGIFLGVVGVATLIVAIIGATFAYFSASATGDNNVEVTAYEFNADVVVDEIYKTKTDAAKNLIPLTDANLLTAINKAGCVDKNGYQACAVYRVTITNYGESDITLNGSIRTLLNADEEGNRYFTDLVYQPLTGNEPVLDDPETLETDESADGTFAKSGSAISLATSNAVTSATPEKPSVAIPTVSLEPAGDEDGKDQVVFYAVVYLEDALNDDNETTDQSEQMGVSYQGQLVYVSGDGNGRITATFDL